MQRVTYANVLNWLCEQDEDATVNLNDSTDCLIARFLKDNGAEGRVAVSLTRYGNGSDVWRRIPVKLAKAIRALGTALVDNEPISYGNLRRALEVLQ